MLQKLGAERCEVERPDLSKHISEAKKIDAVLDLVGNTVMLDSLAMLRRGGRSCLAGWLGGLDPIRDFNPLLQMPSGVYLTFFGSFVFGTPGFPLSDVPLRDIAADAAAGRLDIKPAQGLPLRRDPGSSPRHGVKSGGRQDGRSARLTSAATRSDLVGRCRNDYLEIASEFELLQAHGRSSRSGSS